MSDATPVICAGNSKQSVVVKRKLFAERWLVNGNNGTEAAIHIGFAAHNAAVMATRYMKHPDVKTIIERAQAKAVAKAELTTERWAKEMAAIGHFDPGELYDEDGKAIPVRELPEHVRRAISSVKVERRFEGKGEGRVEIVTEEIRPWDKNTALANIGRHLGVFEKDNRQNITAIQVNISLVG